jgi:hypothetical protein
MQSSLPTGPADQNIKAVDLAEFAEIAKIVDLTNLLAGRPGASVEIGLVEMRSYAGRRISPNAACQSSG